MADTSLADAAKQFVSGPVRKVVKAEPKEQWQHESDPENMTLCQISGHNVVRLVPEIAKEYPLLRDIIKVRYVMEGKKRPTFTTSNDPTNALVNKNGPIIFEFKNSEWEKDIKYRYFKVCNTCKKWIACRDKFNQL